MGRRGGAGLAGAEPAGVRRVKRSAEVARAARDRWIRRAARVAAWNFVLLAGATILFAGVGEAWLRATKPFVRSRFSTEWVPGVGDHLEAHSEVRWTNLVDYWVVARTNRFGFLDREPPSPERARASCHVAVVGDSFVAGREVPAAERVQVRLEEMAARRLPAADVTTVGWGVADSGQIQQLSWWDKWIDRFSPKLVALVFGGHDMLDNKRRANDGRRFVSASLSPRGRIVLEGPDAHSPKLPFGGTALKDRLVRKTGFSFHGYVDLRLSVLRSPPRPQSMSPKWPRFTAFALDQWLERTQRAGASLVVLAAHTLRTTVWSTSEGSQFDWLARETASRGIPLVDQHGYIVRSGGRPQDLHWNYDGHWNPQGHQWAAEAMLEWLERNLHVCGA